MTLVGPLHSERDLVHFHAGLHMGLLALGANWIPERLAHDIRVVVLRAEPCEFRVELLRLYDADRVKITDVGHALLAAIDRVFPTRTPEGYRR